MGKLLKRYLLRQIKQKVLNFDIFSIYTLVNKSRCTRLRWEVGLEDCFCLVKQFVAFDETEPNEILGEIFVCVSIESARRDPHQFLEREMICIYE